MPAPADNRMHFWDYTIRIIPLCGIATTMLLYQLLRREDLTQRDLRAYAKYICVLSLFVLFQQQAAFGQLPEERTPPTLTIVKSFQTAAVTVKGRSVLPDKHEPPPAGKSWLVVIAKLTTPRPQTWVSLDTLRVFDESGTACTPIGLMDGTTASVLFYDVQMAYGAKILAPR